MNGGHEGDVISTAGWVTQGNIVRDIGDIGRCNVNTCVASSKEREGKWLKQQLTNVGKGQLDRGTAKTFNYMETNT